MLRIGLTGGIGSGKTAVSNLFRQRRVPIIDADKIAHRLVEPGQPGLHQIILAFGNEVLDAEGRLDRARMRQGVFASSNQLHILESILHPMISRCIDLEVKALSDPYCIVCVPLLVESGWAAKFDRILVVDCPVEVQIQRVRARDNLEDNLVTRILDRQATRASRLSIADDVILNTSDLRALDKHVERLHNFYFEMSKSSG